MTEDFYASYLEKKFRKRTNIVNWIILLVALIVVFMLYLWVNRLLLLLCIPYLLIHNFFIRRKLVYHLYLKPIDEILSKKQNVELYKNICEHLCTFNADEYWLLSSAISEGDYQKIVDFSCLLIKKAKNSKLKSNLLSCLMAVYYDLNDIDKLRALKDKLDELLMHNPKLPEDFWVFNNCYLNGDTDGCKKYLNECINRDKEEPFYKARSIYRLGLLNYRNKNFDEARKNFEQACEIAPNVYFATYAKAYIDAIEKEENYNHAEAIGEILPQEDFDDSLKFYYPSKKKVILHKLKNRVISILCVAFIILTTVFYCFVSKPYRYPAGSIRVEILFGCTVDEFFDKDLEIYDEIGDLRKCAETVNGNIVFHFSRYQAYRLKNSEWLNAFRDSEKPDCVEISDDLKEIKVFVTPEMKNYSKEEWATFTKQMNRIIFKIYLYQIVSNNFNENDVISYKKIDSESGILINEIHIAWNECIYRN